MVDLEAGLGTLLRPGGEALDVAIVVVEPTQTSMDVGRRVLDRAEELGIARRVTIANRLANEGDLASIQRTLGTEPDVAVDDDPAVRSADLAGQAVVDHDPDSSTVRAVADLARRLVDEPVG